MAVLRLFGLKDLALRLNCGIQNQFIAHSFITKRQKLNMVDNLSPKRTSKTGNTKFDNNLKTMNVNLEAK